MNEEIKIYEAYLNGLISYPFQKKDKEDILNYITNLQEENKKLKEKLNCKEYFSSTMPEDTEFVILTKNNYDRQQKDLALENIKLKETNEEHRKINGDLRKENQKLVNVIDELEKELRSSDENDEYKGILDILIELKGGSDA